MVSSDTTLTFDKSLNVNEANDLIDFKQKNINKNYEIIDTEKKIDTLLKILIKVDLLALDLETTSIDANIAEIVGISICFESKFL